MILQIKRKILKFYKLSTNGNNNNKIFLNNFIKLNGMERVQGLAESLLSNQERIRVAGQSATTDVAVTLNSMNKFTDTEVDI